MKKDLNCIEGTVAYVMKSRMAEIDAAGDNLGKLKAVVINILEDPTIKQQDLAKKYIFEVNRMTNVYHLLSTIATYLTGDKLGRTGRARKYA